MDLNPSKENVLQRVARWSSTLTLEAIPHSVRAVGKGCLIDTLGVALAGAATPVALRAQNIALSIGRTGTATVFGQRAKLVPSVAAFANGAAAHALDFDDNCYAGAVHGSAVILPAALAVAEAGNATGAELLTAFIAGSEAEYALGAGATLKLYERGWWTTGVLGPIGASAAAAHLLGLDEWATASALGTALAGSGGAKASFGTDAKPLLAGRAAEAGVVAALLASSGASGPADAVEHVRGFANLFNNGTFDESAIDSLGSRWYLLDPGIDVKRIPICLSSHAAVDAVLELIAEHRISADAIARISCDAPPIVVANLVHDDPKTRQEAQFSMPFAIAAAVMFGDITLSHLEQSVIEDPSLRYLMRKVGMRTSPYWDDPTANAAAPEGAHVSIELTSGQVHEGFRAYPRGAASHPLTSAEIDAKFLSCVRNVVGIRGDEVLEKLHRIEDLLSVRDLL
jgi:2-methylcitrate dehydratase PrpD